VRTINIKALGRVNRFDRTMERFVAFIEHFGIIGGGGWNSKKQTATFYMDLHKPGCCAKMPTLSRLTPDIRAKIDGWLVGRGLSVRWSR